MNYSLGIHPTWTVIHKKTSRFVIKNGQNVRFKTEMDARWFMYYYDLCPSEFRITRRLVMLRKGRKMRYTVYRR